MTTSISIEVSHPTNAPGKVEGFKYFWAFNVTGIRKGEHCQACFAGRQVPEFSLETVHNGQAFTVESSGDHEYVYVCGGGKGKPYRTNFHLALRYHAGKSVSAVTYNGYVVAATNAVMVQIPSLPTNFVSIEYGKNDGELTVRCKNFQFAYEYFVEQAPDARAAE